jgi:hypothetical protein
MPAQREKIIKKAREILENSPEGVRYSELVNRIHSEYPEIKIKVIQWETYNLHKKFKDILKPERGLFILEKYLREGVEEKLKEAKRVVKTVEEKIFYSLFANYLVNELEECTKAISLGGSKFQDKWGTPDVIGVEKFLETEPIRPLPEIVSAEIKIDTTQLITAFGQACAYKLFSHKVYLVVPKDATPADIGRLESLCLRFGIGLITFDRNNPENPDFRIITRAIKSEPDYFYVNQYLKRLGKEIEKLF